MSHATVVKAPLRGSARPLRIHAPGTFDFVMERETDIEVPGDPFREFASSMRLCEQVPVVRTRLVERERIVLRRSLEVERQSVQERVRIERIELEETDDGMAAPDTS